MNCYRNLKLTVRGDEVNSRKGSIDTWTPQKQLSRLHPPPPPLHPAAEVILQPAAEVTLHLTAEVTLHLTAEVTLHLTAQVTLHPAAEVNLHLAVEVT